MTQQEARVHLEHNWWKNLCPAKPEDCHMIVGDFFEETPYEYGFYAYSCENGEEPPEDLEEWDIWRVSKKGEYCRVNLKEPRPVSIRA